MDSKKKIEFRKALGAFLKNHREKSLKIESVRQLSFVSNLDQSKLSKIEKGQIDFRFDTLMEICQTYKLKPKQIFDFPIQWKEDE